MRVIQRSRSVRVPVAVISNLNSRRNQRLAQRVRTLLGERSDVLHVESRSLAELPDQIRALRTAGVTHLAINGGDGTVQQTLSIMLNGAWPDPPLLAMLPGGTTNMTAHDLNGGKLGLLDSLAAFLGAVADGQNPAARAALQVSCPGNENQYGFFLGLGAIVQGIQYCHERIYRLGLADEIAPGVALLRAFYGIARREPVFAEGLPVTLTYPGAPAQQHNVSLLCASTLNRLFLGMTPFWGDGPGALAVTMVREHPARVLRSLPALLRGRPNRHMTPATGYTSCRLDAMQVSSEGQYTLDGEIFPAADAPLTVGTSPALSILELARGSKRTSQRSSAP